jgi:hypothetical protein
MFVNFAPPGNCFGGFLAKVDFKPAESAGTPGKFDPDSIYSLHGHQ